MYQEFLNIPRGTVEKTDFAEGHVESKCLPQVVYMENTALFFALNSLDIICSWKFVLFLHILIFSQTIPEQPPHPQHSKYVHEVMNNIYLEYAFNF